MFKVSVLIPAYNAARYLSQALDSVLGQTFRDFEILVIDDGSTDNTRLLVESYRVRFSKIIRYVYQKNQGLACARNTGLQHACGEYIALLDADDAWLPQRLEKTVKVLDVDPSVGIVHANIQRINEDGANLDIPSRDLRCLSGYIFDNIFLRDAHLACPTVLFRKKCLEETGVFDPNLARLGCEDRELWLRISRKYKVQYVDEVLALYRVSTSSMSQNKEKMLRARIYVVDKFCPPGDAQSVLRNKALARIYKDLGDEFLLQHDFAEAKKNYWKAIGYKPFSVWAWLNLGKAILKVRY